jgi:rhodanese-related sulfurtransferase
MINLRSTRPPSRLAPALRGDRLHLVTVLALAGVVMTLAPTCAKPPQWRAELERVGIRFVSAKELKAMMDRRDGFILVDARDEVHYNRGHIRGAISIPAEDKPLRDVDVRRPKRLLYPQRLPADRDRALVFYCGGTT